MIRLSCALLLICSLALPVVVDGRPERSRAQVRAFLRQQGLERTPEGYEVDHIVPLCAGGKGRPGEHAAFNQGAAPREDAP